MDIRDAGNEVDAGISDGEVVKHNGKNARVFFYSIAFVV